MFTYEVGYCERSPALDAHLFAWDWEVSYVSGSKRCGALGRTYARERAAEHIQKILNGLPPGVGAKGRIVRMGSVPIVEGDRRPIRVEAEINDGRLLWVEPSDYLRRGEA
ncbi:hypothetical protein JYK22_11705, partial [Nonomuraea sp. RK-328]|nr:hypothetical protein [Nonomuraea sp. RK-328]